MNELPPRVRSFLTICVPFLRTPLKKKCVPLTSKSVYPQRGTHNFINVRILKTLASSAADQALSISGTRKTLQVLSCKVYGGDSWTRTNDPIDVNDVLYRLSHATQFRTFWHLPCELFGEFSRTFAYHCVNGLPDNSFTIRHGLMFRPPGTTN